MTVLPFFPLNIVVFPGEKLNLHVFEPRYKALIQDVLKGDGVFGIPSYVINKIEIGTSVKLIEVVKKYSDGRMDVITKGRQIFKVESFQNPARGKLYAEGKVNYLEPELKAEASINYLFRQKLEELFSLLKINPEAMMAPDVKSYDIAHFIGLKKEEEYELLFINSETERQQFILRHLEKVIPVVNETEKVKNRIRLNGHFRNFDPLNF